MAKVERRMQISVWLARRLGKNGRCLPRQKANTDIAPMASQIGSTLVGSAPVVVAAVAAGSMAVAAGSMAVGVISIMRASPEQVTSALQVGTPLAQAVGKKGLGGVAAAGKEGLGVVAADEKEGLL